MKKYCILFLFLPLFSSCISVSNGYFAKEPDFFIYPTQSILFFVQTGDLQKDAQCEKILSDFFIDKGFSKSFSLKEIDPLYQLSDFNKLSQYLKKHEILYVISVSLTNSETNYDYVPQTIYTNTYNYGSYSSSNSYSTGGYYTSSTIKTFSVIVSDSDENRYALFEIKSDDSLNLFDGDDELFEKLAQNIYENLASRPYYKSE